MSKVVVEVYGAGSEIVHIKVSKEAFEWWKEQDEEDLVNYLYAWDADEVETEVPEIADFLTDEDGDKRSCFDSDDLIDHYWRIIGEQGRLTVDVDGENIFEEFMPYFEDIVTDDIDDDPEDRTGLAMEYIPDDSWKELKEAQYIITYESVEKGNFIECEFETEDFDKNKLVFQLTEDWNGNDVITGVKYDGEEIDNDGGDSNGKGLYAHVWEYGVYE